MNYVLYTRCSTNSQNISIDEQKQSAYKWLKIEDSIIEEYSEIESGRNNEREQLKRAISSCQKNKATLLITRLDRLSRSASFTMALADSNIDFLALDCPNANKLTIGFMSLMNQDYAEKVSTNTKKALNYLKSKGVQLGKPENFTAEAQKKGSIANKIKFENLNKQATKIIVRLRNEKRTFEAIAIELNNDGYTTAQGSQFNKGTVKRLFDRATEKTES
jgi:DNA invertase Pin-like site-specific DNA recombinase